MTWAVGIASAGDISMLRRGPVLPAGGVELSGATSSDLSATALRLGAGVGVIRGLEVGARVASSMGDPDVYVRGLVLQGRAADLVLGASAPVPLFGEPAARLQADVGIGLGEHARVELGTQGELAQRSSMAFPLTLVVQPHEMLFAKLTAAPGVERAQSAAATVGSTLGSEQVFFDVAVTGGLALAEGQLLPSAALGVKVVVPRPAGRPTVAEGGEEDTDAAASAPESTESRF